MSKVKSPQLFEDKVINHGGAFHYVTKFLGEDTYKHHRYDGPAIEPHSRDSEFGMFPRFFLGGIEYNFNDYDFLMKDREGIPFYKTATALSSPLH
jgi:hypothetical protein